MRSLLRLDYGNYRVSIDYGRHEGNIEYRMEYATISTEIMMTRPLIRAKKETGFERNQ